jgi:hypothetical protein
MPWRLRKRSRRRLLGERRPRARRTSATCILQLSCLASDLVGYLIHSCFLYPANRLASQNGQYGLGDLSRREIPEHGIRREGTMLQAGRSRDRVPMRWIFSNLPNPSGRNMAAGSTQPLTEMSTRILKKKKPGGEVRPSRRADNLAAIC